MIKFFRKIRQNLLSEGKIRKYLKYAIGEIILVVIGIMIAIQFNNYNERNQKQANGIRLLERLHQEINQDIIYLDSLSSDYKEWYKQTQFILDSVLNGKTQRLEKLEEYNIGRGSMNFIHINKSSYSEILNSGNDIEIENQELKNKIIGFFQDIQIDLDKLNFDNEKFHDWANDNIDVVTWHRLWANRNLENEDWKWLQDPSSDKYRAHEGYVLFFQNAIKANLKTIKEIRSKCRNMNALIEKEIKE